MNRRSFLPGACAVFLFLAGFLPIANWIDGGHEAQWYATSLSEWTSGTAIGLGMAVVLVVVLRRFDYWPADRLRALASGAAERPLVMTAVLGAFALATYGHVAYRILSGRPLLIDEIVQVMQARFFALGTVTVPAAENPEFFSALHVVDVGDRVFSQFPPGGPLMLLPGVLLGATWVVGPLTGAAAVMMFWQLVRRTESSPTRALGAAVLFATAPFTAFMAGSHMNHVPTLAWLCVALWSLHRLTTTDPKRVLLGFACGLSLGMMAAIRPVDGAAFAVPAGLWLLWRTIHRRLGAGALVASGVGVLIPAAGVLWYNQLTTGDPMLFGYELLWGPSHGLGFHQAPWGVSHTPARGLELISLMFLRLQTYLFETPVPALVPAMLALGLTRLLNAFDRYLLASSVMLVGGYFAYWHDGFFLGPRFAYLLLPVLVIWTVRLPSIVKERYASVPWLDRAVVLGYGVSVLVALTVSVPARARQYAGGLSSMRHDYTAPASDTGVRDALILVRESWGAQLIARLWALGVPRSETEGIYRTIDTCALDATVTRLERDGVRGEAALQELLPMTADSARLIESELSPDRTERVLPGSRYGPTCQARILEDRGGYSFLAPLHARDPGSNIYARDLHARDTLLLAKHPGRAVYLLRAASTEAGAPLVLESLNSDSARAAWRAESAEIPE